MAEKNWWDEWKPAFVMVVVNVALAILNILVKKAFDGGMNQLVLVTYRQAVAAVFIASIAYFRERKTRPKLTARILGQLFCSAMLGAALTQYFFFLGIRYTSPTFSCAFINMVPVVTFIMALPLGLESVNIKNRAGIAKVLGTLVCISGALLLTTYKGMALNKAQDSPAAGHHTSEPNNHNNKAEKWTLGSLALVGGCLCWSSWFLLQSKIGKNYPSPYSSTALLSFFSVFQEAALCFAIERDLSLWAITAKIQILTVFYSGIVGGLGFVGMSWCVKKRGPVFTAAFSPLIQILVAIIDFFLLRSQLHLGSVLGSILIIAGLYFLLWGKSEENPNCESKQIQPEVKGGI